MSTTLVYQGMFGSNNEQAALDFVKELGLTDIHYIEGITAGGVIDVLKAGKAKYGVVATYNNLVGDVEETVEALVGVSINIIKSNLMHIHHALFTKEPNTIIKTIASHSHALSQCSRYISQDLKGVVAQEITDTAIGAKHLANGTLPADTAVLCRQNAGKYYDLHMIAENVADDINNYTTFIIFELA